MSDSTDEFIKYAHDIGFNIVIVGSNVGRDTLEKLRSSDLTVIQQGVRQSTTLMTANTGKGPRGRWGQIR